MAGFSTLTPDQCVEFIDFPWFSAGDFPIKFKYTNKHLLSKESYPPGHYIISKNKEILKSVKGCDIEILGKGLSAESSSDYILPGSAGGEE